MINKIKRVWYVLKTRHEIYLANKRIVSNTKCVNAYLGLTDEDEILKWKIFYDELVNEINECYVKISQWEKSIRRSFPKV